MQGFRVASVVGDIYGLARIMMFPRHQLSNLHKNSYFISAELFYKYFLFMPILMLRHELICESI